MVIPDIVKDAFSDVPNLPTSERPLICVTPRWMPEENFSDSASVAQIQFDAISAAGGIPIMIPLTEDQEVIAHFVEMCDGCIPLNLQKIIHFGLILQIYIIRLIWFMLKKVLYCMTLWVRLKIFKQIHITMRRCVKFLLSSMWLPMLQTALLKALRSRERRLS